MTSKLVLNVLECKRAKTPTRRILVINPWPSGIVPVKSVTEDAPDLVPSLPSLLSKLLGISLDTPIKVEIAANDPREIEPTKFKAELEPPTFVTSRGGTVTAIFGFISAVPVNAHISTELHCNLAFGNGEVNMTWLARIEHERYPNLFLLVESVTPDPPTGTAA